MMWTDRTALLLGDQAIKDLKSARVAVVGVGGVGAYAAEMLSRAGVGNLLLIDSDTIGETNLNRQILALRSTIGLPKTQVLRDRILDINPDCRVDVRAEYICESNAGELLSGDIDFVVDAIDTLSPKIALIQHCLAGGIPLVSAMGAGAKTDITKIRIADISKTRECPLAHQLRKRLHRLGIFTGFQAVYSEELPDRGCVVLEESRNKKSQVGTVSYLPAVFGCACAQAVILGITQK